MGMPDHLTCLLEICMQVMRQQLELDMEQQTGSKSGKVHIKDTTFMAENEGELKNLLIKAKEESKELA